MKYKIGDVLLVKLKISARKAGLFPFFISQQYSNDTRYFGYTLIDYDYDLDGKKDEPQYLKEYLVNTKPNKNASKEYITMHEQLERTSLPKELVLYTYCGVDPANVVSRVSLKELKALTLPFDYD